MPESKKKKTTRKVTSRSQFDKPKSKKRISFSELNKKWKALILVLLVVLGVGLTTLGVYLAQLTEQPFQAGDTFNFQITFNQGAGEDGNLDLYYYNCSGLTDQQIGEIRADDSNFVDYFAIPFLADGIIDELTANASYLYRYYVQTEDYTGSYGYVTLGLNEIFLNLLPYSLNVDVTSLTYSHTLENTTETNWTCTYSQSGHAFNSWFNKTGNENISWVFKFDFDVPALDSFVDVEWFTYETQNTIEIIDGNSLYVEIQNYGFTSIDSMNFKFFDEIGTSTANVTRIGIGYGNANNFIELGSHS